MAEDNDEQKPLVAVGTTTVKKYDADKSSFRFRLFQAVAGESALGHAFEEFMTVLVWVVIIGYIFVSVPEWAEYEDFVNYFGFCASILYALEYIARLWTSAEDETYGYSRCNFLFSWFSAIDLITIVPYLVMVAIWRHHEGGLQFLRVLRLLQRFDKKKGCGQANEVVSDVVANSKWFLLSTTYLLLALWLMVAALFYLTERSNPDVEGRYDNLLRSMWWSLINLMGEFPLSTEFTPWGKVVSTLTMVIAIGGVQGMTTGIISDSYSEYMEEERVAEGCKQRTEEEEAEEEAELKEEDEALLPSMDAELSQAGVDRFSEAFLEQCYLFINAFTMPGRVFEGSIMLLVIVNVTANMLATVDSLDDNGTFQSFFDYLEPASVGIFTVEYFVRLYAIGADKHYHGMGRITWTLTNFYPLVDLFAVIPFYLDLLMDGDAIIPTTFVRVLRLFRIFRLFKAGKMVEGLNVFSAVLRDKASLIGMLLYGCGIWWIFFSVLMYYTERENPITKIAEQFNTVPRAMWVTLLNFTGEYPIGDYTDAGKVVSTFVAFFAIAAFGIPTAIFADGLASKFQRLDELKRRTHEDQEEQEEETVEVSTTAAQESSLGQLFLVMEGQDLHKGDVTEDNPWWEIWGLALEYFVLFLIMLNTMCYILITVPAIEASVFNDISKYVEAVSVVCYTIEYLLRLVGTYGDPRLAAVWYAPLNFLGYMFSFWGLIDMAAILPWYLSHAMSLGQWSALRAVRLLRLLRIERYLPVFKIFHKVLQERYHSLVASVFIMVVCTLFFATLLHETEQGNIQTEGISHYTQSHRFRSVPSSLFYTFIHLTGDYPLMKYSPWGRFVNFFMIILAQGLVGIPLGIIVEGFQAVMEAKIDTAAEQRQAWYLPDKDGEMIKDTGTLSSTFQEQPSGAGSGKTLRSESVSGSYGSCAPACLPVRESEHTSWVAEGLMNDSEREVGMAVDSSEHVGVGIGSGSGEVGEGAIEDTTKSAKLEHWFAALNHSPLFDKIQLSLMVVAIVGVVVATEDMWRDTTFGKVMHVAQCVVAGCFAIEYLARLYACPVDPKFEASEDKITGENWEAWKNWPRFCYATDFVGIVDLLAWLPFFVSLAFRVDSQPAAILQMSQILLVLKFDRRIPAITLLDNVLTSGNSGRLFICTAALSMILWVLFAALLYLIEKDQPEMDGSFANMPMSLFMTIIFIGGEWARVDLEEPVGQLVGFVLALVGIGVIGIPVAVFFEGYSDIAEEFFDNFADEEADPVEEDKEDLTQPDTK